ncbi:MAG: hypothetical protein RIB60_04255 [Phycisphaerales bacterium]
MLGNATRSRFVRAITLGVAVSVGAALPLGGCALGGGEDMASGPPAYGAMGSGQMFEDMGPYKRSVTTSNENAQAFFDQGINWLWAFNHDEAVLAFRRATEYDPGCAMAWWGISYAQGPNYNDPMMPPSRSAVAWEALQRAMDEIDDESQLERDLIAALAARYAEDPPEDRAELNAAFADRMGELYRKYPDDSDIGAMAAEAMMVRYPWQLYSSSGEPAREQTYQIVAALEHVLERDPYHPGANHLYIHALEPSNDKARALPAADRLCDLVPSSGHMQHMPSHIYVQTGRWHDSIEQNAKAMKADDEYRVKSPDQGIQHGYMAHNAHMLAFSAMMVGQEEQALAAAQDMWDQFPPEMLEPFADFVGVSMCGKYDVLKRFGRWDELIAEPAPPEYLGITRAMWRAHRAVAFAAKKDFEAAKREQMRFRELMQSVPNPQAPGTWFADTTKLLLVSDYFVAAEIALQQDDLESAANMLEQAALIEDAIGYGEPPVWLQPVRHTLGAVYVKAGRWDDAERVYRDDLKKWPNNGWSLLGMSQALAGKGDEAGAARAHAAFEKVWEGSPVEIPSSCMCIELVDAD